MGAYPSWVGRQRSARLAPRDDPALPPVPVSRQSSASPLPKIEAMRITRVSAFVLTLAVMSTACGDRGSSTSGHAGQIDGIDVTVTVVKQPLRPPDVWLDPIPDGSAPKVSADRALTLALAQITWHPQQAHLYLGARADHEMAWVAVFSPAPCEPMIGPSPNSPESGPSLPSPTSACSLGVVLDANSGALVVEG
jgi:hypothetical protein